jgi:hypothetical protein
MMLKQLAILLCVLVSLAVPRGPAGAQQVSESDAAAFRQIISDQIAAFNADNGAKAWSYAAPSIKQMFPTPDVFMSMVKNGYQPVYRQKSFAFGDIKQSGDRPVQEVTIIDLEGNVWTALYTMQKQPDGSWKISACTLVKVPGVNA